MRTRPPVWLLCPATVLVVMWIGGCSSDQEDSITGPTPPELPAATAPANLIESIEVIYNDELRGADERYQAYENLFPPADDDSLSFIFFFQPQDIEPGEVPSWGLSRELEAHRNIFRAQEEGRIHSLDLRIQRQEPEPLEHPEPGQENWVSIFATNVSLRLMFNRTDGLLVDGGQAEFKLAPRQGRWFITEWKDLPRPSPAPCGRGMDGAAVETSTWGSVKLLYR